MTRQEVAGSEMSHQWQKDWLLLWPKEKLESTMSPLLWQKQLQPKGELGACL